MNTEPENIFQSIPADLSEEVFSKLANGENVRIERIVSKGHTSPEAGWYDQADNEWVMVLKGAAVIAFEHDDNVELIAGSYLNIPAHKKHKVSWTDPDTETLWLVIHYT